MTRSRLLREIERHIDQLILRMTDDGWQAQQAAVEDRVVVQVVSSPSSVKNDRQATGIRGPNDVAESPTSRLEVPYVFRN